MPSPAGANPALSAPVSADELFPGANEALSAPGGYGRFVISAFFGLKMLNISNILQLFAKKALSLYNFLTTIIICE